MLKQSYNGEEVLAGMLVVLGFLTTVMCVLMGLGCSCKAQSKGDTNGFFKISRFLDPQLCFNRMPTHFSTSGL